MCTEFFLKTKENNLISGRTFDFPFDPLYKINYVKKNDPIFIYTSNEEKLFYKNSQYNYMFLSCFNNQNIIADGMNEQGLIINVLWLEDTIYIENNLQSDLLFFLDIPQILLSQCQNIAEVKNLLKNKKIWTKKINIDNKNAIIGKVHYSIHDKNHNSIIIEIENGIPIFTDNELQVITNQPHYYWHEKNVDNYLNLTNKTISNIHTQKKSIHTDVNGNGLIGLPGDFTSISRFIKTQKLISFIPDKEHTDKITIGLVDKILGNVTLPLHALFEKKNNQEYESHSYYSIIKNQNKLEWYIKKDIDTNYTLHSMII